MDYFSLRIVYPWSASLSIMWASVQQSHNMMLGSCQDSTHVVMGGSVLDFHGHINLFYIGWKITWSGTYCPIACKNARIRISTICKCFVHYLSVNYCQWSSSIWLGRWQSAISSEIWVDSACRGTSTLYYGAFLCSGDFANVGDSSNGSAASLWRLAASAHHSSWEKHLPQYFDHCSGSLLFLDVSIWPSRVNISCVFGKCIMADTGRQPSSLRVVLRATPARVPPHWPAEYVTNHKRCAKIC